MNHKYNQYICTFCAHSEVWDKRGREWEGKSPMLYLWAQHIWICFVNNWCDSEIAVAPLHFKLQTFTHVFRLQSHTHTHTHNNGLFSLVTLHDDHNLDFNGYNTGTFTAHCCASSRYALLFYEKFSKKRWKKNQKKKSPSLIRVRWRRIKKKG